MDGFLIFKVFIVIQEAAWTVADETIQVIFQIFFEISTKESFCLCFDVLTETEQGDIKCSVYDTLNLEGLFRPALPCTCHLLVGSCYHYLRCA